MTSIASQQSKPNHSDDASLPHHSKPTSDSTASHLAEIIEVSIPDGRRNSGGETLPSSVETWKPNLDRRQSWNHQDLKRLYVEEGLKKEDWDNDAGAEALGYSYEGGEEGKK
ncbi:hypothetical protein BCON_0470g00060 [Botryotinia convoluta]|uniref:Uncharacterized protein n=1 Tax=Botryotinia convoluta TaxID=54673 RepID=A0A4Z1HHN9_9HELO|nr:hypothetical protein BCON_0470g00060 [Botryotinia convoluta]